MTEPARTALQLGTRTAHRRLESRLALTGPKLTPARYRAVLAGLLGLHRPLDRHLAVVASRHPRLGTWASTPRTSWLEHDLQELGVEPRGLPSLPDADLPNVHGPAGALGCLYVVEGSALGGRQVADVAAGRGLPCRFFHGFGARTGQRWRSFRRELTSWEDDAAAVGEMVVAATRTFAVFEAWLCDDPWQGGVSDLQPPAEDARRRRVVT